MTRITGAGRPQSGSQRLLPYADRHVRHKQLHRPALTPAPQLLHHRVSGCASADKVGRETRLLHARRDTMPTKFAVLALVPFASLCIETHAECSADNDCLACIRQRDWAGDPCRYCPGSGLCSASSLTSCADTTLHYNAHGDDWDQVRTTSASWATIEQEWCAVILC